MMRGSGWMICLVLWLPHGLAANERLALGSEILALKAQARACYLGFIELYDAAYYRTDSTGAEATRCVRVSYLREIGADDLDQSTREIFRIRHGDEVAQAYLHELDRVGQVYASVRPGDQYTYCVDAGRRGVLLRDGAAVMRFASADFAERFLQLWVAAEDRARRPRWAFGRC